MLLILLFRNDINLLRKHIHFVTPADRLLGIGAGHVAVDSHRTSVTAAWLFTYGGRIFAAHDDGGNEECEEGEAGATEEEWSHDR